MKNYIYDMRTRKGISLDNLAVLANVGKTTISNIENRKKNPNLITAFKIAKALNISILELFEMEEEDF